MRGVTCTPISARFARTGPGKECLARAAGVLLTVRRLRETIQEVMHMSIGCPDSRSVILYQGLIAVAERSNILRALSCDSRRPWFLHRLQCTAAIVLSTC